MMKHHPTSDNPALLDSENATEMARLLLQDRFLTQAMGGPLAERQDIATMQRVLDVGCGPGGWVLDVAFASPKVDVVGIDVSHIMVTYGRAQAWTQGLENAHFQVMDVREPLAFPDQYFDLINIRLLASVLSTHAWPPLIQGCQRLLRPGGILRLTEAENGVTTSAAWERIGSLCMQAMHQSGHSFAPGGTQVAITPMLRPFLVDAGFEDIEDRAHVLNFSAGTPAHVVNSANVRRFLRRMVGNRRETWESTLQTSIKWLEKRAVVRRCCAFVGERLPSAPMRGFRQGKRRRVG